VSKDPEKRIKVLKKKLKQIEDIKARVSAGEQVELTQIQKLDSEATILKEVLDIFLL
jgi:translation initiation factor 2A